MHLWITFVFVGNTCVSLGITKTSPEDHGTLLAFHALRLRFTICILVVVVVKLYLNTLPSSPMDDFHEGRHTNYI